MGDDERERSRRVAVSLMRMALALLDRAHEGVAAARLAHALDAIEEAPPPVCAHRHGT